MFFLNYSTNLVDSLEIIIGYLSRLGRTGFSFFCLGMPISAAVRWGLMKMSIAD